SRYAAKKQISPSDRIRTLVGPMENATWSIVPCRPDEVRVLVQELGLIYTAASVLARRGYADPIHAAAFLAGALPGHDPFRLRDMEGGGAGIHAAGARGR